MTLEQEFEWYRQHQEELVGKYQGKVLVIRDGEVQGVYESEIEAAQDGARRFAAGNFLVQRCEPGDESYTRVYHSRVYSSVEL